MKVSWRCFYTKVRKFQSSNATRAIFGSKTSHIIASTCNWLCGGYASRVLIWQANIHGRLTWTSVADRANPTIKSTHIHRWQPANSFLLFCVPYPSDRLSCFNKTKQKQAFHQVRFHLWSIITRRVETDNNTLLRVRDELSFHGLMLLVFRFELNKNVLEFVFQNLKSSIGSCFEILHFVVQ